MTHVSEMNYGPRARMQPVKEVPGLNPDARFRLGSQFRTTEPGVKDRALKTGDSLVGGILEGVDKALNSEHQRGSRATPVTRRETPHLMPAIHILSIAEDASIRYGPVSRGKRSVHTDRHARLGAVVSTVEQVTQGVDRRIVDEAIASVYGELRAKRDVRRQEERERLEAENSEVIASSPEVVLFERIA